MNEAMKEIEDFIDFAGLLKLVLVLQTNKV